MLAFPITSVDPGEADREPYNGLANHEIMMLGEKVCDKGTTLVFDSHYMSLAGMFFSV